MNTSKKLLLFALFGLTLFFGYSQLDSITLKKNKIWNNLKYDGTVFINSVGNAFTQPLRWQSDDFLTAGGIVAGTSILYLADNEAQDFFLRQEKDIPNVVQDFGWYFGSPQNFFIISAGIYGFGLITTNEKVRRTGVLIISSAVTSGLISSLTKTVVGRSRPNNGNFDHFEPFSSEAGFHSFPSGHSVLSFTMAHAIAKQFENIWIKAGIYAIGSIAPISRLWANAHWVSDVGFGIALSIVVVYGIDNFMKKKEYYDYQQPKKISWNLAVGRGTIGVVGTF